MNRLLRRTLLPSLMLVASAVAAQTPSHRYNFYNSLADANGGPSLVSNGGVLGAHGYTFGMNQGLSLSNVFTAGSSYTIVLQSMFSDLGGYRKIVDFKDQTSIDGYFLYLSRPYFRPGVLAPPGGPYSTNTMATTVLTRDASTDLFSYYVNGTLRGSFIDTQGYADFTSANGIASFFEADYVYPGEASGGTVDYLATYDTALSAAEVSTLVIATPEPATALLIATGLFGMFGIARRRGLNRPRTEL